MNRIVAIACAGMIGIAGQSVAPISHNTVTVLSSATAALAATGTYTLSSYNDAGIVKSLLFTAGVGGLTYVVSRFFLNKCTPLGRYERALTIYRCAACDQFLLPSFDDPAKLHDLVRAQFFGTHWPLVLGHEHYVASAQQLENAAGLLQAARSETSDVVLKYNSAELLEKVTMLRERAVRRATLLMEVDRDEFDRQMRRYQKYLALQMQQQQVMLAQQQLHDAWWDRWDRRRRRSSRD